MNTLQYYYLQTNHKEFTIMLPYQNKELDIEIRIVDLLSRLTLEEKISLCSGCATLNAGGIERLGVPVLSMTDGPQGVRTPTPYTEKGEQATAFPCGIALAATFNPDTAEKYGSGIAMDCSSLNIHAILGPGMNIMRTPLNGRNFEYFGEDPVLSGKIAAGYIRGTQQNKVASTPKHLACNNQEICRTTSSSDIDERTLRELYLTAFEIATKESDPWMMMSSYNRINGEYASECGFTQEMIAKGEWGFSGVMVSDWGAVHDTLGCALGGLDLEMPGPGEFFSQEKLLPEVKNGTVPEAVIDEKVRRVLRLMFRTGVFDNDIPTATLGGQPQLKISEEVAAEAMVLLKNDRSFLPLDPEKVKKIVVVGPNADFRHHRGSLEFMGGSGAVFTDREITPLAGLQEYGKKYGIDVEFFPLIKFEHDTTCPAGFFGTDGIACRYYHTAEDMAKDNLLFANTNNDGIWTFHGAGNQMGGTTVEGLPKDKFCVKMQMTLCPPTGKAAELLINGQHGACKVTVNGKAVVDNPSTSLIMLQIPFAEGEAEGAAIEIVYEAYCAEISRLYLGWRETGCEDVVSAAMDAAAKADAVIFTGGTNHVYDREALGWGDVPTADIPDLQLPGEQVSLINRLAKANKNIAAVLINGSVVSVEEWINNVPAILEAWYPGEKGGKVIAEILFGDRNPAGRLPFTWGKDLNDYACHANGNYPGNRKDADPRVRYDEGIFVGYRHFDRANIEPRFPFGFGLSYSSFALELISVKKTGAAPGAATVTAVIKVRNTSDRAGAEVIQLYVSAVDSVIERPEKEMKAFAKVFLAPGEEKEISLELKWRDFACWDVATKRWTVPAGKYTVSAASTARDIFGKADVIFSEKQTLNSEFAPVNS